jgi:hypothetical protein
MDQEISAAELDGTFLGHTIRVQLHGGPIVEDLLKEVRHTRTLTGGLLIQVRFSRLVSDRGFYVDPDTRVVVGD